MEVVNRVGTDELAPDVREPESQPAAKYATLRIIWSRVILPFLAVRIGLELVGVVAFYYILPLLDRKAPIGSDVRALHLHDFLLLMWRHFDSGFYLWIAYHGYSGADTIRTASNWAFFPLYPLFVHLAAAPFGGNWNVYYFMACLISTLAALVASIYLYRLTEMELGQKAAGRAVIYLLLFPMSFYLFAMYPESLFLALAISSIYYARVRRWWLVGVLGGLASLTRPTGIVLVVALAWEYWQWRSEQFAPRQNVVGIVAGGREWLRSRSRGLWLSLASGRTWSGFAALALVPLGLFLFFLYAKIEVGTFQAYFLTEKYGWNRTMSNPIDLLHSLIQRPLPPNPYEWNFYSLNMLCIIVFVFLLIPIFRRLPTIYSVLALVLVLMPLTSGKVDSIARYYLTVFPVYMFLAWWSTCGSEEQQALRHQLLIISFALLLAVGTILFALGVYAIA
ncbi:MAG: hypothetical protein NVSMB44_47830 [Ktedonobacteraceae bacterium]